MANIQDDNTWAHESTGHDVSNEESGGAQHILLSNLHNHLGAFSCLLYYITNGNDSSDWQGNSHKEEKGIIFLQIENMPIRLELKIGVVRRLVDQKWDELIIEKHKEYGCYLVCQDRKGLRMLSNKSF